MKTSNDFIVEDLGTQEEYVYDIEVEDNHNFFGNDILLHNSIYFQVEPFVEKYCKEMDILKTTAWVDAFYKKVIDPIVDGTIGTFALNLNAFAPDYIKAEREIIADSALFVAKKKYTARVRDNEGEIYSLDDPYIKVQGLEIQQGGTATFAKKYLKQAIPVILDKSPQEIKDWFSNIRTEYGEAEFHNIAKTIGVTKVENPNWGKIIDGRKVSIPFGSKACVTTNNYIKKHGLAEQFPLIEPGEKVKILYLNKPNPLGNSDAFAFTDTRMTEMFSEYIDRDQTFEKFFISPLENMTAVIGIDVTKNIEELDEW